MPGQIVMYEGYSFAGHKRRRAGKASAKQKKIRSLFGSCAKKCLKSTSEYGKYGSCMKTCLRPISKRRK